MAIALDGCAERDFLKLTTIRSQRVGDISVPGRASDAEMKVEHSMSFENIAPIVLPTAPGRIADAIRASILDGSLAPGSQLTEMQLAERLNVSRGSIREAMQRLIQEGLLRTKPHHGTFVIELGTEDIADIYLARRAVETTAAVRLMGGQRNEATFVALDRAVDNLRAAVDGGHWADVVGADICFHEMLVDSAKSQRLTRMFTTLTAETRMCMAGLLDGNPGWLKRAVSEHVDLVAALRRGDKDQTVELLDSHFSLDDALSYRAAENVPGAYV
ncbi:MAG: GntR family transcriptional regulator [Mycobacterium sp.]